MNKLIPHTDYEDSIDLPNVSDVEFRIKSRKHRQFIKQPLELWMFVACKLAEGIWVVLEEPTHYRKNEVGTIWNDDLIEYQKAKEKCLFERFKAKKIKDFYLISFNDYAIWLSWNESKTIEDLIKYEPLLTKTAIKQLSL